MDDIYSCKFKDYFSSVECSSDSFDLVSLPNDEHLCILSEISLLPSLVTHNFRICSNHRDFFSYRLRLRLKKKNCGINTVLQHHSKQNFKFTVRRVTEILLRSIARSTGSIVPVGTPICDGCRKYLSSATITEQNILVLDKNRPESPENGESNDTDTCTGIKRKRRDGVHCSSTENPDTDEVEKSVEDIREMKSHIIRSKNQERARTECVEEMRDGDVLITCDWAMKFLPRKYREGQVDWFAKRGINWHFSVVLFKNSARFNSLTYIHIFESQVPQDASVTAAIMIDVVQDLTVQFPTIQKVHFFSDNAGCYKSSSTIASIKTEIGSHVESYNFSEAQNGKGPCDRKASHAKSCIKRFVNEGHDVTTAEAMKTAIDKLQTGSFRVSVVDAINDVNIERTKFNIPGISTYHNFKYEDNGLRMWKAFGIGEGKLLPWKNLPTAVANHLTKVVPSTPVTFSRFINDDEENTTLKKPIPREFYCTNEGCVKIFSSSEGLDQHRLTGGCELREEKMTLSDRAKSIYSEKLNDDHSVSITSGFKTIPYSAACHIGWALKTKKPKTVFSSAQKKFMVDKFQIGKTTGKKVDPHVAAAEMLNGGVFKKKEFLTGQQIASYFSRLSQQGKHTDAGDYAAATDEVVKNEIKSKIATNLHI